MTTTEPGRARAGAFMNYASLLTASLATGFFGLGVWDGLAATVLGTLCGAVVLGLLSHTGARSGLPQIAFTRRVFGAAGARVGAFLTLFLAVGWFAVDTVIAAQAGVQLFAVAGLGGAAGGLAFPLVLAIAGASVVVAVYGHATIKVFETFGALAFAGLSLVLFLLLAPQFAWTAGPSVSGADYPGAFALGFMVCFALVASWFPFASDYSRYLPADTPGRGLTWWPVAGVTVPLVLLGLFALTMGVRLRRWQTALGCGVLGALLATYAVVIRDFHTAYQQFLLLTYLWAPAWAAIVLLAFFARGDRHPLAALVAWALGTGVSLLFVNYPNIYPGARAPNQPLIDLLHGADLSGLVSAAVAALVYVALLRPVAVDELRSRLLPLAAVVTPNLPEAQVLLGRPVASREERERAARPG